MRKPDYDELTIKLKYHNIRVIVLYCPPELALSRRTGGGMFTPSKELLRKYEEMYKNMCAGVPHETIKTINK